MERKLSQEDKLAIKATPDILKVIATMTGEACEKLAGPACNALKTCGCKDYIAIKETIGGEIFPKVADQYFKILDETIQISQQIDSQNLKIILGAILADEESDIDSKVELARKLIKDIKEQQNEQIKIIVTAGGKVILGSAGIIILGFGALSYMGYEKAKIKDKGRTDRTAIIMDGFQKIAKELNPVNAVKDAIIQLSDNAVELQENYYKYKNKC